VAIAVVDQASTLARTANDRGEDDMALGYQLIGNGPAKVMVLHGWFGDETMLDPMRPALSAEEFTYCCLACRGCGKSKGEAGRYTMDEIADDALAVADGLGWDRFALLGHSMGGMAIQRVLVKAKERVRGLVAVTPVPATGVPFDEPTWQLFASAAQSLEARAGIIDLSTGGKLCKSWTGRMARRSWDSADPVAFAAYLKAWAKTDFSAEVRGLPTPVLAVIGANDPSLTAEVMRATYLAFYPNARLEVLTNAGHYPMDEAPVALATTVEAFLRALP
jgi:pimeloyl-ACP methyl ester carboxylesterase